MSGKWLGISGGIVVAVVITIAGCSGSGDNPTAQSVNQKKTPVAATVTDPVCGMKLTSDQVVATYEYQGRTFQFCMASDRDAFVANPEKYMSSGPDSMSCTHHGDGGMDTTNCPHHDGDGMGGMHDGGGMGGDGGMGGGMHGH